MPQILAAVPTIISVGGLWLRFKALNMVREAARNGDDVTYDMLRGKVTIRPPTPRHNADRLVERLAIEGGERVVVTTSSEADAKPKNRKR